MHFWKRLKELRISKGVTQVEVACSINIKERQYQNIETGRSLPSFPTIIALADYFDVSIDYLIGRTDDPKWHHQPGDE